MNLPTGYTHLASFYGVPCYFNEPDSKLVGRSFVSEFFLKLALGFHFFMWWTFGGLMIQMGAEPSFPIRVKPVGKGKE